MCKKMRPVSVGARFSDTRGTSSTSPMSLVEERSEA